MTRKQQLISNPPVTRGCLLTKRLITLHPPRNSRGKQVEGARRTAFIYRVLRDLTIQIELISLVVEVLGCLASIYMLSSSCRAHKISSAMFYTIRARYLHNTTESFMTLTAGAICSLVQYLGVFQRQTSPGYTSTFTSVSSFQNALGFTVPQKVSRQQNP